MVIRFKHLFFDRVDEIVKNINKSLTSYSSEEYTTEEISNLIFDRLISEGVSARIITYTVDKPFYSVQYYKKNKWVNFDYTGLDMFFQPVFNKTLNPQIIVKVEMVNNG